MLHLLIDTSTWLDLAKRRNGQRTIVMLRGLVDQRDVELLVPQLVIDEFQRNRAKVEHSMTTDIAQRFKTIRKDLNEYGGTDLQQALETITELAHHAPLMGAVAARNFDQVLELLLAGTRIEPSDEVNRAVINRGIAKLAPTRPNRNSVADALLIELYAAAVESTEGPTEVYSFVTSNSEDFSAPNGDNRLPHPDLAKLFARPRSSYRLGVDGLSALLFSLFGAHLLDVAEDPDHEEEPRRLGEILEAERKLFDRVWYQRSLQHEHQLRRDGEEEDLEDLLAAANPGRLRVEETITRPGELGPYTAFELGMLNGKLSALRWVLGSEWDFLDT